MSVELSLFRVEADCKCFPVHDSLATTYCILFHYNAHNIDIRYPEPPLEKARSNEVVLPINEELGSDHHFSFLFLVIIWFARSE